MLTGRIRKRVDIPHEPGEWMEFRMLSGKEFELAQERRLQRSIALMRSLGGELLDNVRGEPADGGDAENDPLAALDTDTLLYHGIVAWSYDEPVTRENIDLLDERTRVWAARFLATWHIESEVARKNA